MIVGKYKIQDLEKLFKTMQLSKSPSVFTISVDGPKLNFNYVDDHGKIVIITIFDSESTNSTPIITKTDYL